MMDVSLRRSVCLMGSVLAVILLLAWPCYAAETPAVVYFYPSDAVRGYPLDVIAFVGATAECTLTMSKADAFTLPSSPATNQSTDLNWIFYNQLSVRVLVKPTLEGPYLNVSVKCGDSDPKVESVAVVSDVDMVAAWSSSPSPADMSKPLAATLTLTNQGGHTAVDVSCIVTSAKNSSFTLACGEKDPAQAASSCQLGSVRPHTPVLLKLNFDSITDDDNVTVQCTAHNVVNESSLLFPFEILLKGDADIMMTIHVAPAKVYAGLNATVETTIENKGRAKADNLTCELVIDKPESNVLVGLTDTKGKCELVQSATNVTTGARCAFGDLESQANATVSLVLHVDAAAKADDFNLAWSCGAESLARVNESITIPTPVEGNFTLVLPTNSSIAAGTQALLFRMKNPGPSFIRNGICNFTLPSGVKSDIWSHSKYFTCDRDETKKSKTMLNCVIEELPPGDTEFNLSLKLEDITLEEFFVDVKCQMLTPAISYEEEFTAYVGVVPSPSPTPSGQAPDNSMMVVVTVIVAVGLLIVIAIWWRRRQESSGWDAAGPTARSPSLNRFTDMELSVRSDD